MTVRVGINGFGRIGRNFFRAVQASGADIEVVAVNDLTDNQTLAHLLKYDSILGRFPGEVSATDDDITVDGKSFKAFAERDPANLKWSRRRRRRRDRVDRLLHRRHQGQAHADNGAKKVIISAPAKNEDLTVVIGVNDELYDAEKHTVISNASCTTNCLAPLAKVLHDAFGDREGSDDHDPRVHAGPEPAGRPAQGPAPRPRRRAEHRADLHRCREGDRPGAAGAQGQAGRLRAARPGPDRLGHRPHRHRRPRGHRRRGQGGLQGGRRRGLAEGLPAYTEDEIVSTDIVTDPASCIFDAGLTKVIGNQVKVVGWYDNEWGYSNRLVDLVNHVGASL